MNTPSGAGTVWPSKGKDGANSENVFHLHGYIDLFFGAGNSWRRNNRNKFVLFYGESYEKVGRSVILRGFHGAPLLDTGLLEE